MTSKAREEASSSPGEKHLQSQSGNLVKMSAIAQLSLAPEYGTGPREHSELDYRLEKPRVPNGLR